MHLGIPNRYIEYLSCRIYSSHATGIVIAALSSVIGAVGLVVVVAAIVSNAAAASAAAAARGDADNPRCGHSSSNDLVSKSMSTAAVGLSPYKL